MWETFTDRIILKEVSKYKVEDTFKELNPPRGVYDRYWKIVDVYKLDDTNIPID